MALLVQAMIALTLALGAASAIAQKDSAAREPVVAPLRSKDMKPGYGVVESVTAVQLARSGQPVYRIGVRMPDGSVQFRDLDKPEFKVGDNVLLTNAGDIVPD